MENAPSLHLSPGVDLAIRLRPENTEASYQEVFDMDHLQLTLCFLGPNILRLRRPLSRHFPTLAADSSALQHAFSLARTRHGSRSIGSNTDPDRPRYARPLGAEESRKQQDGRVPCEKQFVFTGRVSRVAGCAEDER